MSQNAVAHKYRAEMSYVEGQIRALEHKREQLMHQVMMECPHHPKKMDNQCVTKSEDEVCGYCERCFLHLHLPKWFKFTKMKPEQEQPIQDTDQLPEDDSSQEVWQPLHQEWWEHPKWSNSPQGLY